MYTQNIFLKVNKRKTMKISSHIVAYKCIKAGKI